MSANLSKYELLQHRHLSLLKALEESGVTVTNVQGKPWQVELPVAFRTHISEADLCDTHVDGIPYAEWIKARRTMPMLPGYEWNKQLPSYDATATLAQYLAVGWTFESLKERKIIVPIEACVVPDTCVDKTDFTCKMNFGGAPKPPSAFTMSVDYEHDHYYAVMSYAGGPLQHYKLKETPVVAHLLSALRCAILAAPAKA